MKHLSIYPPSRLSRFNVSPKSLKGQRQGQTVVFSGNRYTPKPKSAAKKAANEAKDFARTHGRSIAFSLGGSLAGSFLLGGIIGGLPGSIVGLVVGIVADTQLRKRGI